MNEREKIELEEDKGMLRIWFLIFSGLTLLFVLLIYQKDSQAQWKVYQEQFHEIDFKDNPPPTPKGGNFNDWINYFSIDYKGYIQKKFFYTGIRQIWAPELSVVDRCPTCHLGIELPEYADAPQPFRTHPTIPKHDFKDFGCTTCHQGQGWAVNVEDAHSDAHHWTSPMLPLQYVEASCPKCHQGSYLKFAKTYSKGKELVKEAECKTCHLIPGFEGGGNIGPPLEGFARKVPKEGELPYREINDESERGKSPLKHVEIEGVQTEVRLVLPEEIISRDVLERGIFHFEYGKFWLVHANKLPEWTFEHFKNPQGMALYQTESVMGGDFTEWDDEKIHALTCFALSLTGEVVPSSYMTDVRTPVEKVEFMFAEKGKEIQTFARIEESEIGTPVEKVSEKNPIQSTEKSIVKGYSDYFKWGCVFCHGEEGNAKTKVGKALVVKPRDFTNQEFQTKKSDRDLYISISEGRPGTAMAAHKGRIPPEGIWNLVNYIRTFSPDYKGGKS